MPQVSALPWQRSYTPLLHRACWLTAPACLPSRTHAAPSAPSPTPNGRWRQAADGGAEVWGAAALRRPRGGTAAPAQPRIPLDGAFGVLRRQRAHLRRLHLDEGALQGGGTDAGMLAAALQAACGPGSGLTDLTIQGDPHPAVTQARAAEILCGASRAGRSLGGVHQ